MEHEDYLRIKEKYKIAYLDPDNRRSPKTENYCRRCYKDFKPNANIRYIYLIKDEWIILHPDSVDRFIRCEKIGLNCEKIGLNCGKVIGLGFTLPVTKTI